MPGFIMVDGPFPNTKAPNPRCCSDPTVLCRDCAALALAGSSRQYFDRDESLAQAIQGTTTNNCSGSGGPLDLPEPDAMMPTLGTDPRGPLDLPEPAVAANVYGCHPNPHGPLDIPDALGQVVAERRAEMEAHQRRQQDTRRG